MKKINIEKWESVRDHKWEAILLGNGASIAIHQDFAYQTLHGVAEAQGLLEKTEPIFEKFGTTDFEHVLLACWYAEHVNLALGTPSPSISDAYAEVRKALIAAVHSVHPVYTNITSELEKVGDFASTFRTVVSLNYDLTLYWAMLLFNQKKGIWFKDAFHSGKFRTNWEYLRRPYGRAEGVTLVFYPHGNLCVARDYTGDETKIATGMGDLLETITQSWSSSNYVPVFVSEGNSNEKLAAIYRSHYLTNVYEKVLPSLEDNLVVYGWSFDERDEHVLKAILKKPQPTRLAVSVFTGQSDADQQAFCHQVHKAVCQLSRNIDITFFDSRSPGCWNNP